MSEEASEGHLGLAALAEWSTWLPYEAAVDEAPRLPGVYLFRVTDTGQIVYVGMAGERAGSGHPEGLRGRLSVYRSGKGAVSGFGEAALDRALADPVWVERQLATLNTVGPRRAKLWAADAIRRVSPEVCWSVCFDGPAARTLEKSVEEILAGRGLWNR